MSQPSETERLTTSEGQEKGAEVVQVMGGMRPKKSCKGFAESAISYGTRWGSLLVWFGLGWICCGFGLFCARSWFGLVSFFARHALRSASRSIDRVLGCGRFVDLFILIDGVHLPGWF